jgi:hypothetical protein
VAKKDEQPTSDAVEEFLRNLVSTHEDDQMKEGLTELAEMFHGYFVALQRSGFHYSKAFILTRDWHGMWWTSKFNHLMMHEHPEADERT